jgi:hypothetical protein
MTDINRQVRTFADELVGQFKDIYKSSAAYTYRASARLELPYRPTGHPSSDDRPRTPKQVIGDIAWSYLSIVDSEDLPPDKKVSVCVGDLDAALHAAFHAGRKYVEGNQ